MKGVATYTTPLTRPQHAPKMTSLGRKGRRELTLLDLQNLINRDSDGPDLYRQEFEQRLRFVLCRGVEPSKKPVLPTVSVYYECDALDSRSLVTLDQSSRGRPCTRSIRS